MKILVTGSAGFIGYHTCKKLINLGHDVVGIDNINDYYDINLKYERLSKLGISRIDITDNNIITSYEFINFKFSKVDIVDIDKLSELFIYEKFDYVIHLAAQAGVRYSIENPHAYVQSNLVGFVNMLESCRHNSIKHFVYASSSSVYGDSNDIPFSETQNVSEPVSLYAATKVSNELLARAYSNLYNIPSSGLRFFTVYGPLGRPDMSPMLFASAILNSEPIKIFNNGEMRRDFTFIDDIVEGVTKLVEHIPLIDLHQIYNIGNSKPVDLLDFVNILENLLGSKSEKIFMPMQDGDVKITYADTKKLHDAINYQPSTTLIDGLRVFVEWFKEYNIRK